MITENLLVETSKLNEIIDLSICAPLYKLCNDTLFDHLSGSDFVCFLNLKYDGNFINIKPRKKQHVLFLISIIEEYLKNKHVGYADVWVNSFLKHLKLEKKYYIKYRYNIDNFLGNGGTKEFVDAIIDIFGVREQEEKRRKNKEK